jgi:AraC-like DNA-binding protein
VAASPEKAGDPTLAELLRLFPSTTTPVARIASIAPVLRLMGEEVARRGPGYVEMINGLAAKLIIDTARAVSPRELVGQAPQPAYRSIAEGLVRTAEHYLRDNLERSFKVRDIAAQVNLSERQLTRVLRKYTGTSILDYLTTLRIERAAELLLSSDLPIKQVAADVGYPDTHYFTTLFGRRTGRTPAAFRESGGAGLASVFRQEAAQASARPVAGLRTSLSKDNPNADSGRKGKVSEG